MEGFSAIPLFVAVVENGSFSTAAKRLGISRSAVSKRISQLEEKLGVQLLYRTTRRISLTEAGEYYFENAVQALSFATEAEEAVTQLQAKPQGRLRINIPMSFGRLHIIPLIPGFLAKYPGVEIEMVMDDRMVDLVDEGVDVAIRGADLPDSTLIARKLAPMRYAVCASPQYIEQHGVPQTPEGLVNHNCLLFSYAASEWHFIRDGETQRISVSGNYRVNNGEAVHEAVRQGVGVSIMPTFIVGPDIAAGRLVPLLSDYQIPQKALYALFPKREYLPAKVRVFIDYVVACFGEEQPYWDEGLG